MANLIRKLELKEQERLLEELGKTKPGTKEYAELQKQLGAFTIMQEKRSCGNVKPVDVMKFTGTLLSTGLVITADQWAPRVIEKIKLSEFVQKIFK